MRKTGITTKLFAMLLVTFGMIVGAVLIGSVYFFEPYYVDKKISGLEKNIFEFLDENARSEYIEDFELVERAKVFSFENQSPLAIKRGSEIFYPFRRYAVELEGDFGVSAVDLGSILFQIQDRGIDIRSGMEMSFMGFWDEGQFMAVSIDDPSEEELSRFAFDFGREVSDFTRIAGRVISQEMPEYDPGSMYRQDKLFEMTQVYASGEEPLPDEVSIIEEEDRMTGIKNYLITIPYEGKFAFCLFSMQPVNDVISVIPGFMKYVVFMALILVVGMSFVITRIIVRPIIRISGAAEKMAGLDFSERVNVKSSDELGMLSGNLNTMADELEYTLSELEKRNERLQEELDREKLLEQARKSFVADASHELKTPLGIVQAYTERLEDKFIQDEKAKRYAAIILDENRKMNKLINDLLELSKLESMTYALTRTDYDISDEIVEIAERFTPLFEEKGIEFGLDVQAGTSVNADPEKMGQVITNMISNALKYTPPGGNVQLKFAKDEGKVVFRILNEVENMEKIDMEKIWDRFYKADKARSRKMGGTGLGLSITKSILDLHGFDFGASKAGDMIEFYFEI